MIFGVQKQESIGLFQDFDIPAFLPEQGFKFLDLSLVSSDRLGPTGGEPKRSFRT